MELNEYQERARATDELTATGMIEDGPGANELRLAMGIADEGGEVLGKYKKGLRGSDEELDYEELIDEAGDVLWYVALFANEVGIQLEDLAQYNLEKLEDRKERGVIAGSGDNR